MNKNPDFFIQFYTTIFLIVLSLMKNLFTPLTFPYYLIAKN